MARSLVLSWSVNPSLIAVEYDHAVRGDLCYIIKTILVSQDEMSLRLPSRVKYYASPL